MGYDIGGKNTGVHFSFAQYLAQQLSTRIKNKEINTIEGCFISNRYITNFIFDIDDIHVESSAIGDNDTISMFRIMQEQY
jgi:hypothetical protein